MPLGSTIIRNDDYQTVFFRNVQLGGFPRGCGKPKRKNVGRECGGKRKNGFHDKSRGKKRQRGPTNCARSVSLPLLDSL